MFSAVWRLWFLVCIPFSAREYPTADGRLTEWKCGFMEEIQYPYLPKLSRVERIQVADRLRGKQLWVTHWWKGKYWVELQQSQSRNVQYVLLRKDGHIMLGFKDGVIPLNAYGKTLFNTKERADSELAYIKRRDATWELTCRVVAFIRAGFSLMVTVLTNKNMINVNIREWVMYFTLLSRYKNSVQCAQTPNVKALKYRRKIASLFGTGCRYKNGDVLWGRNGRTGALKVYHQTEGRTSSSSV